MAYETDVNKAGAVRRRSVINLSTQAGTTGRDATGPHYKFYELEPAVVIDITLDGKDGKDYQNIGVVKVRPIYSYVDVPEENLPTAVPLDSNIKSYPLIGEIVIVMFYGNRLYYTQRLNFFNNVNNNRVSDITTVQTSPAISQGNYASTQAGNPNETGGNDKGDRKYGKYFTQNLGIKSLLPLEGDIIFEGRFGNSMRFGGTIKDGTPEIDLRFTKNWAFGNATGSPIVIIRNGQKPGLTNASKESIVEDINKDASSIYLTFDQLIGLVPSSKNQDSFKGSAPSNYKGNQIILNSGRIILNAKTEEIFLFANKAIGLSTQASLNIDATQGVIVNSPKISLGLDATEHLVLGDSTAVWLKTLIKQLQNLVNAILQSYVLTGTGPSSPIQVTSVASFTPITQELTKLNQQIDKLLSKQNITL